MGGILCRKCRRGRSRVAPAPTNGQRSAWIEGESRVSSTTEDVCTGRKGLNGDEQSINKTTSASSVLAGSDQRTAPPLTSTEALLPGRPLDTPPETLGESSDSCPIESDRRTVEADVTPTLRASDHPTQSDEDIIASPAAREDPTPGSPLGSKAVSRKESKSSTSVQTVESNDNRVSTTSGAQHHAQSEGKNITGPEHAGTDQKTPVSPVTEDPLLPGRPIDKAPDSRCGSGRPSSIHDRRRGVEVEVTAQSKPNSNDPAQSDSHARPTMVMVLPWTDNPLPDQPLVSEPISRKASNRSTSTSSLGNECDSETSQQKTENITRPALIGSDQSTVSPSPVREAPLFPGQSSTSTSSVVESISLADESISSTSSIPEAKCPETYCDREPTSIISRLMPKKSEKPVRDKVATLLSSWDESGKLGLLESSTECIPQSSTHSISDLATALKGDDTYNLTSTEDQIALSYKIYCWVAKNVMYVKGSRNTEPNDVLRTGRAVCHGYTILFQALAEEVGLSVRRVSGNTREWLSSPGTRFIPDISNQHTWNIVKIDDVWFPVDCTFGSGSTINGRFVRKFTKLYFFSLPEQLILTHWVEDELLQLLEYPATLTDLQQLIAPNLETLSLGIVPMTEMQFITLPPNTYVAEVQISCPSSILLTASLSPITNDQTHSSVEMAKNLTFVKNGKDVMVSAILPTAGSFLLEVFRRNVLEEKGVHCLSYIITSETKVENPEYVGFPRVYSHTAAKCGFKITTWRGSENQPKHVMKAYGTLEIDMELESNAKLDHYVKRGKVSYANSARRNCLTKLSPNRRSPTHHHLNVVFPSEGWWTVTVQDMEQRLILMEYEIYSTRGIQNTIYPSTTRAATDLGISLNDNYTPTTYGDLKPLAITFSAPLGLSYDVELNQIDENGVKVGRSAPDYCTYVSPLQAESLHTVHAILPPGTWSLDLYAGKPKSTTLKCALRCEPLNGSSTQLQLAYPIVHKGFLEMGLSFPESILPYTRTCSTGLFKFPFSSPNDVCYSVSLKKDGAITSAHDGSAVVSKPEGSTTRKRRINVLVPHPGNWTLTVFAQKTKLLEEGARLSSVFKLHFEATACPLNDKIFPHVTSQFACMSLLPPYNIEEWLLPRSVMSAGYPKHLDIPFIQLSEEVELFREIEHNKQKYTGDVARLKANIRNGEIIRTLAIAIPMEGEWVFKVNARFLHEKKPVVSKVLSYAVRVTESDS